MIGLQFNRVCCKNQRFLTIQALMSNLASALKSEIARISRRESRSELESLRKATAQHRSAIAALKRQVVDLERRLKQSSRAQRTQNVPPSKESSKQIRFSAQRLAAHRAKLGLSAKDYATLVGVSALSIYKWESGSTRPRATQLSAIAEVRRLGAREAHARLAET
jgi:DNA-binding transcriptional regulator YiaG